MSAKFIPILEPVGMFLDQYDKSEGDEDKALVMAYRGMEDMEYNIAAEPKTVRLPVEGPKVVTFPADYVSWVKIGLLNNNGELVTIRINNSLTTFRDNHPNRLSLITADVNSGVSEGSLSNMYLNYWNGLGYSPLFGIGYGIQNFGSCRVDETNNVIVLAPDFQYDSIILEYISCPENSGGDYQIDRRLREPLIAFIAWKFRLDSDTNYYARLTEARRKITPFNLQTFNQVIREQNKFCLKM
jgi:hypothetical protein